MSLYLCCVRDARHYFIDKELGIQHTSLSCKASFTLCTTMPRLFPKPWEGTHPASPKRPEPLPVKAVMTNSVYLASLLSLTTGACRLLFCWPGPGSYSRVAAYATPSIFVFQTFVVTGMERRYVQPLLEAEGVPLRTLSIFKHSKG